MDTSVENLIRRVALDNAIKYNGKTQVGSVIGTLFGLFPEQKKDAKTLQPLISQQVNEINAMSLTEQKSALEKLGGSLETKTRPKQEGLQELDDAKQGNVVMRFAPSASGPYFHIGHAITGGLTSAYVKKYGGKFILRIEDTDSDKAESLAYTTMPQDAQWAFGNVHEIIIQSDRLELYYSYARRFIEMGKIYVCSCAPDQWKDIVTNSLECPCRNLPVNVQIERYESMFDKNKTKEGDCVLRFKSDMTHPNPAMRDFPLMRINDTPHVRQGTKYRVWPLMNLSVFVDDVEMGMTHIIRAKDHADNAKRQELMYNALNKPVPKSYFTGRYNIEGLEISKTRTKELIAQGVYSGWEDVRLAFLRPLRRRGYQAGAFLAYTTDVGLSAVDKSITAQDFFSRLNAFNKDIIDPVSNRYFLIEKPYTFIVDQIPQAQIELDLHPNKKGKGGRPFSLTTSFLIEQQDANFTEGMMVRLIDYANFTYEHNQWKYHSCEYDEFKKFEGQKKIIHWLPASKEEHIHVSVLMPDAKKLVAIAEKNIVQVEVDKTVQFERFGFCRLDAVENAVFQFWYAHR